MTFYQQGPPRPNPEVPMTLPWRVGRTVGRTIYRQVGPDASDEDVLIGVMVTPQLAYEVVTARNAFWFTYREDTDETPTAEPSE